MRKLLLVVTSIGLALFCCSCVSGRPAHVVERSAAVLLATNSPSTLETLAVAEARFSAWLIELHPTQQKCLAAYEGLLRQPSYAPQTDKEGNVTRGGWPLAAMNDDYSVFCRRYFGACPEAGCDLVDVPSFVGGGR